MKHFLLAIFLLTVGGAYGQTKAPVPDAAAKKGGLVDFSGDLDRVTADLKQKFEGAPAARTNFEANLQAINELIVKHQKDGSREQLARLYLLAAHIQADGLTNRTRAMAIWSRVMHDFPGTLAARGASISLAQAQAQDTEVDLSIPEGLEIGNRFPEFTEQDASGAPLALAGYRGRVTMVDFWATWCGPCKAEMPNVIATYEAYHAQGFDIIGVSLDNDLRSLSAFVQANGMTWQQFFDGQGWKNKLAVQYRVNSIPMSYLLDRHGVIIGKGLRGQALAPAVARALANH
jgi:thiol-disulfide isomerase/thioredoxin